MTDPFQPKTEPARSIYRAFVSEAKKRDGRSPEVWMAGEVDAVFQEAVRQARARGLRLISREEVAAAEACAMGSTDYAAKWVRGVVDAMHAPAR